MHTNTLLPMILSVLNHNFYTKMEFLRNLRLFEFQLHKYPWLSMVAIIITSIISIIISSTLLFGLIGLPPYSKISNFTQPMLFHTLTGFIIAPLILRLPKGKTTYSARGFRGIVLTGFLSKYSDRKSIIFSSIGFSLMHLLNLGMGREFVWVMGQLVWTFIIGLFYGYVFIETRSLLPSMIVHYLSNAFLGSLTGYMQSNASTGTQALYGITLTLGIIPTVSMFIWARFFITQWLHTE